MAADFQPAPTYADVILIDPQTGRSSFNPIWLDWFLALVGIINSSGGGSGAVVHNSTTGLQGGTANQYYHTTATVNALLAVAAAGVYTPTLTGVTNVAASTAYECQYLRIGNTVTVSGRADVDPTAGGLVQLGISLPIASNIGAQEDCAGVAFASGVAGQGAAIRGDAANDRAEMVWITVDVTNQPMYFTFTYQVI